MESKEAAKRLIEINEKLYDYLTKFNILKEKREEILEYAKTHEVNAELKSRIDQNIIDFEEVLKVIKELEEQAKKLK